MAKLYVFGIGGTGARVIRSLTMLLATGLDLNGYELVPILVDPDLANGDLNRTVKALESYQRVREPLEFEHNRFFKTTITPLSGLNPQMATQLNTHGFNFKINNSQTTFDQFIGYTQLNAANQALINLLYTQENLNTNMDEGFRGNPNMGSIVLNQFTTSDDFTAFATSFGHNDRIFIISSIFGGTGAAGFPLLLNNIRKPASNVPNPQSLRDSVIGALTVLPYYKLNEQTTGTDSKTYVPKAIAALSYYDRTITTNNYLNAMYYIADPDPVTYSNHAGGESQLNNAHIVELAGALAILDFAQETNKMNPEANRHTVYREFGITKREQQLTFDNLGPTTQKQLKRALGQFLYVSEYLRFEAERAFGLQPAFTSGTRIGREFLTDSFYKEFKAFCHLFDTWLGELKANQPNLALFRADTTRDNIFKLINGVEPKPLKKFDEIRRVENFHYFNQILQEVSDGDISKWPIIQKFGAAIYRATKEVMHRRFNA